MIKIPNTKEVMAEGTIDRERKAELTLLALTHGKSKKKTNRIISELGVTRPEYERLIEKYGRVLERYRREND